MNEREIWEWGVDQIQNKYTGRETRERDGSNLKEMETARQG